MMPQPRSVLLRARTLGLEGLALLESAGPVTSFSRYSLFSAAPSARQRQLPERPVGGALFPAWIGGLTYEAAAGLPGQEGHTHPPDPHDTGSEHGQFWAHYPSGLLWDRLEGSVQVLGEPHLDWQALLAAPEAPAPALEVGALTSDFPRAAFEAGARAVQGLIRAGETYQVNLSHRLRAPAAGDPLAAYLRLAGLNPSPFMAYFEGPGFTVVSGSPERLVLWDGERIAARPIAGTRRRGADASEDAALEAELRANVKERAEHLMLLDLARNDLGRAAAGGSVWVPEFETVERYSHVMHLVSEVEAAASADLTLPRLLAATFPGGTITGAPKRRVMAAIRDLEPVPRGWYTGSLGYLAGPRCDLNILIRTVSFVRQGAGLEARLSAGAGVVIDSDPAREYRETEHKAAALIASLRPGQEPRPAAAPAPPAAGPAWRPAAAEPAGVGCRVLLLDNFDSFTYNLAHDLRALGAEVTVRDQLTPLPELLALEATHVLVGPGPGDPQGSGVTLALTRHCLEAGVPLLGVCLGHQALGEALGARLARSPEPVHGKAAHLTHDGQELFEGIPQGAVFTRYHSLRLENAPAPLRVTARSEDGAIMALSVAGCPAWGVQFHPESVLSRHGRRLLGNWLRLGREVRGERGLAEHAR